jgi:hypothetical protein
MEVDIAQRAVSRSRTESVDGGAAPGQIIPVPPGQWISGFNGDGSLALGRDILWVGGFEDMDVDDDPAEVPLWDLTTADLQAGPDYAYEGSAGIRLTRGSSNEGDAVTTHLHRMLVGGGTQLSITGMVRASPGAVVLLQVSWYPDTRGPSSIQSTEPIVVQSPGQWQPFRADIQAPADAVAFSVFLRLLPPVSGIVHVDFDNLRAIEWAASPARFSPQYNFALLTGPGELTFTQQVLPGGEAWFTVPTGEPAR